MGQMAWWVTLAKGDVVVMWQVDVNKG